MVIRAENPRKLASFYEKLGLVFVKEQHGKGPEHYCAQSEAGFTFEIYPIQESGKDTASVRLGFSVTSITDIFNKLQSELNLISPPKDSPWGRRAVLIDPQGHIIELTESSSPPLNKVI